MRSWVIVAMLSVIVLAGTVAAAPAGAAKASKQDEDRAQVKADEKKVKKPRPGYIRQDGNKVYYHW